MGREKDRLIEEEERGWYSVSRDLVCESCVDDDFLSDFIAEDGKPGVCDYCGLDSEDAETRCVPFDDLMDIVGDGINWAYNSADRENQPYESAEGGYAFSESVFDTYDLVTDRIGLGVNEVVLKDVLRALPDQMWCERGFWSLSFGGALRSGWQEFVEKIKYETRYLFTLPPPMPEVASPNSVGLAPPKDTEAVSGPFAPEFDAAPRDADFGIDYDDDGIPAYRMLEAIGQLVKTLQLVRSVASGTTVFRARVVDKDVALSGPGDFGPPTRERSTQPNRMSPAGIVMFYGALDRETALLETFQMDRAGIPGKNVWTIRDADDKATFNRLHPIPFTVRIPKEQIDRDLPGKLLAEAEGILAWAVAGAKLWYETGLNKPPEVEAARDQWRADMDQLGRFFEERCVVADGFRVSGSTLYAEYKRWVETSGEQLIMTSTAFGLKVSDRAGIHKEHTNRGASYRGIGLRFSEGGSD